MLDIWTHFRLLDHPLLNSGQLLPMLANVGPVLYRHRSLRYTRRMPIVLVSCLDASRFRHLRPIEQVEAARFRRDGVCQLNMSLSMVTELPELARDVWQGILRAGPQSGVHTTSSGSTTPKASWALVSIGKAVSSQLGQRSIASVISSRRLQPSDDLLGLRSLCRSRCIFPTTFQRA